MLIMLMLPEDPTVLRHAANLLENAQEAQAEYNEFVSIHGEFAAVETPEPIVINQGDNDDIYDVEDPEPEVEIEAIRDPDYSVMVRKEAIEVCLTIHGPLTRPQIAEIIGRRTVSVNDIVNWRTTYNPNGDHRHNGALNAPYILVGGEFGKGSRNNPATVVLNTEANREKYIGPIDYAEMTTRKAIRTYFDSTGNKPTHFTDIAKVTGKHVRTITGLLSTSPEFCNSGERGVWQAEPEFYKNGWMTIGR